MVSAFQGRQQQGPDHSGIQEKVPASYANSLYSQPSDLSDSSMDAVSPPTTPEAPVAPFSNLSSASTSFPAAQNVSYNQPQQYFPVQYLCQPPAPSVSSFEPQSRQQPKLMPPHPSPAPPPFSHCRFSAVSEQCGNYAAGHLPSPVPFGGTFGNCSRPLNAGHPGDQANNYYTQHPISPVYSMHQMLPKSCLQIQGGLNQIMFSWTFQEQECQRRLVQFWRHIDRSEIHCSFSPLSPNNRLPNSIVVSCIYWKERQNFFITSVDCILLLEALMDRHFSVDEKNRIRRNLEGFHPLTVSKSKPETAEFFKLIMSFPIPKPRNIEKDVKVFGWAHLNQVLHKIINKCLNGVTRYIIHDQFALQPQMGDMDMLVNRNIHAAYN